ncbi:MAG: BrnT family toxin [Candidatus Zixiibacteriota bacterium]|nr:MAG: BrnT family toxin [candidate division Zixibacteria bacterium]
MFEWDEKKEQANIAKHGVDFETAARAFDDPRKIIIEDLKHSTAAEQRYFCLGSVDGKILTVRFTVRFAKIRIIGAGYWREGRKRYEQG